MVGYNTLHALPDSLWEGPLAGRSQELTVCGIGRFRGIRLSDSRRAHDNWELTCVISGKGRLLCEHELDMSGGLVCVTPPLYLHDEWASTPMDTIWVEFNGTRLGKWDIRHPVGVQAPELAPLVEQIWMVGEHGGPGTGFELDGLIEAVLGRFLRALESGAHASEGYLVEEVVRHITAHFAEPISVANLARRFGCSEGHLHRLFKRRTGQTPNAFLTRVRIQQAMYWIRETTLPINQVAESVGYDDPFYFSRVFRKVAGMPPSDLRPKGA